MESRLPPHPNPYGGVSLPYLTLFNQCRTGIYFVTKLPQSSVIEPYFWFLAASIFAVVSLGAAKMNKARPKRAERK